MGGECSFFACMPSKGLLRPGEVLAEVRRVPGAAQAANGDLDVPAVLARRDEIIHDLDDSVMLPWLEERGVRALPRLGPARRREAGRRRRGHARGAARGHPRRRHDARAAADRRRRGGRPLDQPRGDDLEDGPGQPGRGRGRGRRRRAEPGVPLARRAGDADRGQAAAPAQRGGVRLHAGDRVVRRAGHRHPHRPEGDGGTRRGRRSRRHARRRQHRLRRAAARRRRAHPASRRPRARDRRPAPGRPHRGRRPPAGARIRLAVRDRRSQRACEVHAHGEVPGGDRRRPRARQGHGATEHLGPTAGGRRG